MKDTFKDVCRERKRWKYLLILEMFVLLVTCHVCYILWTESVFMSLMEIWGRTADFGNTIHNWAHVSVVCSGILESIIDVTHQSPHHGTVSVVPCSGATLMHEEVLMLSFIQRQMRRPLLGVTLHFRHQTRKLADRFWFTR